MLYRLKKVEESLLNESHTRRKLEAENSVARDILLRHGFASDVLDDALANKKSGMALSSALGPVRPPSLTIPDHSSSSPSSSPPLSPLDGANFTRVESPVSPATSDGFTMMEDEIADLKEKLEKRDSDLVAADVASKVKRKPGTREEMPHCACLASRPGLLFLCPLLPRMCKDLSSAALPST